MKTIAQQFVNALLVSLLLATPIINAQATGAEPVDSVTKASSFEVGMFMESGWTINLMLAVHQPKRVLILLKDAKGTVLYREYLKRTPTNYRRKFKFDESEIESGVYQFEISDGQQTIVRHIEVVSIPTIEPQRYITYGPQIAR